MQGEYQQSVQPLAQRVEPGLLAQFNDHLAVAA
jgi:hypothetical protein